MTWGNINKFFVDSIPPLHPDNAILSFYANNIKDGISTRFDFSQVEEEYVFKVIKTINY